MVRPLKCRYAYSVHEEDMESMDTFLEAMHGWLGSMTVCCTPMVRLGKWQIDFHRPGASDPEINIDQSKNLLEVERGNDLLAALCIAYAFDKALCQPLVTIVGYQEKEHMDDDDDSLDGDLEEAMNYPALPPAEYSDNPPPVDGYLEQEPYNDRQQPEVDGYLEGEPSSQQQQRGQPDGYLESTPYSDNPEYLEDGGYNDQPDGYIEDGGYNDQQPDGYIEGAYGGSGGEIESYGGQSSDQAGEEFNDEHDVN